VVSDIKESTCACIGVEGAEEDTWSKKQDEKKAREK
jgi:hypothetical protein